MTVIGSQRDAMIPTLQFEELAATLERNGKAASLFISDHSRHAMAVRDDADAHAAAMDRWVATL